MDETFEKESPEKIVITAKKVIAISFGLSLVAAVFLFLILFNMFFTKLVRNLAVQADSLSSSMNDAALLKERGEELNASDEQVILHYLVYYRNTTGADEKTLLDYAGRTFRDYTFFIIDSSGAEITDEYGDRSLMEELRKNGKLSSLLTLTSDSGDTCFSVNDIRVCFTALSNGSVLFMSRGRGSNSYFASYLSPEAVITNVSNSSLSDSDILKAYALDSENSLLYTPDGVIPYDETAPWYEPITKMREVSVGNIRAEYCLAELEGETYLMIHLLDSYARYEICLCTIPWMDIISQMTISQVIYSCFIVSLITLGLFVFYVRQNALQDPANPSSNPQVLRRKIIVCVFLAAGVLSLITYYTQTLCCLSANVMDDEQILDSLHDTLRENESNAELRRREYNLRCELYTTLIADYYSENPALCSAESLEEIRSIFGLLYAAIYDQDGNAVLSTDNVRNISFPKDRDDPFYALNNIRFSGICVSAGPAENIYADNLESVRVMALMKNPETKEKGYLEAAFENTVLTIIENSYSISNILKYSVAGEAAEFIALNADTKAVVCSPWSWRSDETAARAGFAEEAYIVPYFGIQTLYGVRCYARGIQADSLLVYLVHPLSTVYLNRGLYVFFVLAAFLLMTSVLLYVMRVHRKDGRQVVYLSDMERLIRAEKIRESCKDQGLSRLLQILQDFLFGDMHEWAGKSIHDKIVSILGFMIFLTGLIYLMSYVSGYFGNSFFRSLSFLKSLRGLNIFALNANIELIAETVVIVVLVRWILNKIGEVGDARVETVTRLLRSALKYIAVIYVGYRSLINFGFDPGELAASAGIIGVALGIGGRDLITDIIAGLFIVFERDVQVGDVVDVGGYQGRIVQIGMRTTKIIAADGNEKLINNRNMTNIINLSAKNSYSTVLFKVPYSVSVNALDEIFAREFQGMKTKYQEFANDPVFRGVKALQQGMECEVYVEVNELSRGRAQRILTREIKDILERHQIELI